MELKNQIRELCREIEKLTASEQQTKISIIASDVLDGIDSSWLKLDLIETAFRQYIIRHNVEHNQRWHALSKAERETLTALHWREFRAEMLGACEEGEVVGRVSSALAARAIEENLKAGGTISIPSLDAGLDAGSS